MSDNKRNPIAKSLRSPHLKQQVIPDKRRDLLEDAEQMDLEDYLETLGDAGEAYWDGSWGRVPEDD